MNYKRTLTVATIMLLTSICIKYLIDNKDQPIKKSLSGFPMQIGDWQGTTTKFSQRVYDILGVDDSLLANYRNQNTGDIQLYIGYYKSQRQGDIIHSPKNCMPGSGWNITESSLIPLNLKNREGKSIKVIKLVLQNGPLREVALYWFHSRGRVINSEYSQKIYLVWDSITKHRTDGSFIRLTSLINNQDEAQTTQFLKEFAELIYPILNEFIPS
jgi:EpsI family protein